MRHCKYVILCLILTSCDPFHPDRVLNNKLEFIEIFQFMDEYNNVTMEVESDDRLAD
jgi:hypothetical protein